MKVFHYGKYQFVDVMLCNDVPYYAFKCIKKDFDPEIVLVRKARVDFNQEFKLFFDEGPLKLVKTSSQADQLRVNRLTAYAKMVSLIENERKSVS